MADSATDICNRALSILGEKRITLLGTDVDKVGLAMTARYVPIRNAEMAKYPWRFAVTRVRLYKSGATPDWGYSLVYARPKNDLKTIKCGGDGVSAEAVGVMYESSGYSGGDPAPYEVIKGEIHTNLSSPLDYEYIAKITDTKKFDVLFDEALAAAIAMDASEELTQSESKFKRAVYVYDQAIKTAKRNNALMRPPRMRTPGRWSRSRVVS